VTDSVAALAVAHGNPALIIIDTLARNFGAGDENNTKEMSELIVAIDDLKARFPGCSVMIVHHSGHADKQRACGAMALKGALDCEFRIEKEGREMRLINTKMKDAEAPEDAHFTLETVWLGEGDEPQKSDIDRIFGDGLGQMRSAVLRAIGATEWQTRLKPAQKLGIESYTAAAVGDGVWDADKGFMGGPRQGLAQCLLYETHRR